jgi:hypothetical protein
MHLGLPQIEENVRSSNDWFLSRVIVFWYVRIFVLNNLRYLCKVDRYRLVLLNYRLYADFVCDKFAL